MDTTCLLDLEPLLSDPIVLVESEPVRSDKSETWHPTQVYCDKISARFPEADERLILQLGNANYNRYLRCQEMRNRVQSAEVSSTDVVKDNHDGGSSKFHDSGIGTSILKPYADTVMSYGDNDIRKVRLPPLPAQAKDGIAFACVCCGNLVSFRNNRAWKQHIYADLQPWVCLEAECPKARDTFHTRQDWISHLALDHGLESEWVTTKCPLCRQDTGSGRESVTIHLSSHLEEISLGALPVECNFDEETIASEWESLSTFSESQKPKFGPVVSHVPNNLSAPAAEQAAAMNSRLEEPEPASLGEGKLSESWKRTTLDRVDFGKISEMLQQGQPLGVQRRLAHEVMSIKNRLKFQVRKFRHAVKVSSNSNPSVTPEADITSPYSHTPRELHSLETQASSGEDGSLHYSPHENPDKACNETPALTTEELLVSNENGMERTSYGRYETIQSGADEGDHNELKYCYCNRVSFGKMLGCDGKDCKREWFHLECVGLESAPSIHGKLSDYANLFQ